MIPKILLFGLFVGTSLGAAMHGHCEDWWKTAVFYQIYPRSFKDSDNNGIGDLKGILQKLEHVKEAGITAFWLSPIYQSPQVDQGYDISDYRNIDSNYGTLDDFKELVKKAKELGLKVIMDLVPNHTSDKHRWFIESENGNETYRDYYVWHDGKVNEQTGEKEPPNNWMSVFGGSAWEWSDKRGQFYMHDFAKQQPDLNYRNPAVVEEIKEVIKFWLDLGVEGFRVDAVPFLYEDLELRDEPRSKSDVPADDYGYLDHIYTQNLPETFNMIYTWRKYMDDYTKENGGDARIFMTEAYADVDHTMLYYGTNDGKTLGAHFTFNFNFISDLSHDSTADDYAKAINKWLDNIPEVYVSNWVFGNHDNHRAATRLGKENVDGSNMLLGLLPGIAVTYNGEEIGMENGQVKYEEGQDPSARDPKTFKQKSRDFERTPFHWDTSVNAGFNEGANPWLPVSIKYQENNLAAQNKPETRSHYNIYKEIIAYRKNEVAVKGNTDVKSVNNVLVVKRSLGDKVATLLFNVGGEEAKMDLKGLVGDEELKVAISSINSKRSTGDKIEDSELVLDAHEALVLDNIA